MFTRSYPEACPELWYYNLLFYPGFPAALVLHSTLFTAQLLQSSVLLHGPCFPITYVPSLSNLRLSFTVVLSTAAHSSWAFATQTKCFLHLLLTFPILPSAPTALLLTFTQISSFLGIIFNNIEIDGCSRPVLTFHLEDSMCLNYTSLKFWRVSVCRDKKQHPLVFSAKHVAQTPEIKGWRQYVHGLSRYR